MKEQNSSTAEKKRLLIKTGFTAISLLLVLILGIYVLAGDTFAWFSANKDSNAGGMNIRPEGLDITASYSYQGVGMTDFAAVTSWEELFSGMVPGDSVCLKAVYENNMSKAYTASLFFSPEQNGEIPLYTDFDRDGTNELYYFGSQLQITAVTQQNSTATVTGSDNVGAFLVANPTNDTVSFAQAQTVTDTLIAQGLTLPAHDGTNPGTLTVTVTVTFLYLPTINQNAYQGFGTSDAGERCCRFLVTTFQ